MARLGLTGSDGALTIHFEGWQKAPSPATSYQFKVNQSTNDYATATNVANSDVLDTENFWVFLQAVGVDDADIDYVTWTVDGTMVRFPPGVEGSGDIDPPWNLAFSSGYAFPEGAHTVSCEVVYLDGTVDTPSWSFTVAVNDGGPPPPEGGVPFPSLTAAGFAADIPNFHTVRILGDTVSSYTNTQNNVTISGMNCTGLFQNRGSNVTLLDSYARQAYNTHDYPDASLDIEWCDIGNEFGREEQQSCVQGHHIGIYRSRLYGAVDLMKPQFPGYWDVVENMLFALYDMLNDPFQNNDSDWRSHGDGAQSMYGGTHFHFIRNNYVLMPFQGYRWTSNAQPAGTNGDAYGVGGEGGSLQTRLSGPPSAFVEGMEWPPRGYWVSPKDGDSDTNARLIATSGHLFQNSIGYDSSSPWYNPSGVPRPGRTVKNNRAYYNHDDVQWIENRFYGSVYEYINLTKGQLSQSATNVIIAKNQFIRSWPNFGYRQPAAASTPGNVKWGTPGTTWQNYDEDGNPISKPHSSMQNYSG